MLNVGRVLFFAPQIFYSSLPFVIAVAILSLVPPTQFLQSVPVPHRTDLLIEVDPRRFDLVGPLIDRRQARFAPHCFGITVGVCSTLVYSGVIVVNVVIVPSRSNL